MKSLHSGGRLSLPLPPFSFTPIERLTDGFCSRWRKNISGDGGKNWFFTERWGANKGLGEAPKSCTRKEHESATNSIAKRGQGAIAPCRVKGQRPLWGLGQRPNCRTCNQLREKSQVCHPRAEQRSAFSAAVVTLRSRWSAPKLQSRPAGLATIATLPCNPLFRRIATHQKGRASLSQPHVLF